MEEEEAAIRTMNESFIADPSSEAMQVLLMLRRFCCCFGDPSFNFTATSFSSSSKLLSSSVLLAAVELSRGESCGEGTRVGMDIILVGGKSKAALISAITASSILFESSSSVVEVRVVVILHLDLSDVSCILSLYQ